ncbi:MAG: hypothetical protein K5912_02510 [Alphaproteobacteria bacterium]|nr:hypothetical protein [Alphaproteobacteria bacterium]
MTAFKKISSVLQKNSGYAVVLAISIVLFIYFSKDRSIIYGAITAVSALIGYACIQALYREYKKESGRKKK